MNIVNKSSLAATLNNLNAAFLKNKKLNAAEKKEITLWITSRQGLPGSYWNMFAPTEKDFKGIKLFTGEKIKTRAGISHILGEESLRALILLGVRSKQAEIAIRKAQEGLQKAMDRYISNDYVKGTYCCATCTIAYWRNLSAGDAKKNKNILDAGVKHLRSYRDGIGRWKKFPFYYTLLALSGIDLPAAKDELDYCSGVLIRLAGKKSDRIATGNHRKLLINNILIAQAS